MKEFARRTLSGLIYAAVVVAALLGPWPLFVIIMSFALCYTLHEFYRMSLGNSYKLERSLSIVAALCTFCLLFASKMSFIESGWVYLGLIPLLACVVAPAWKSETGTYGKMGYVCAGLVYIALPLVLSCCLVVRRGTFSGLLLLCIFIIVALTDVGAYILGTALGQKPGAIKLAPKISPKKSLWGLFGGIVTGVLAALLVSRLGWLELNTAHSIALGAILSVAAVLGDLTESMWKRYFGVKDSGKLIPGHGGLYDRLDSMLFAIPVTLCYLEIFGLLG